MLLCHRMNLLRHYYSNKISNIFLKRVIRRTIVTKDKIFTSLIFENQCKNGLAISHKNPLFCNRELGTSFPKITDFTNCRDYLRFVISDENAKIVPNDWAYLLDQIVETLPADSYDEQSENRDTDTGKVSPKSTRERGRPRPTVKQYYCHSFTLSVCEELGNTRAALALLDYMKMSNETITNLHRNYVFSTFKKNVRNLKDQEEVEVHANQNLSISKTEEEMLKLCDDAVRDDTATSNLANERHLINVASTLAYTKRWMDGYELWNKLCASKKPDVKCNTLRDQDNPAELFSGLHNCAQILAVITLQNDREDLFWTILNHPSFHQNHLHIRDGLHGNLQMEENMKVFIHYLKYCRVKYKERPVETFDSISQLFEYLRKHFVLINLECFAALEKMFSELKISSDASQFGSKLTCVRVKQNKFGTHDTCKSCAQTISSPYLSQKEL